MNQPPPPPAGAIPTPPSEPPREPERDAFVVHTYDHEVSRWGIGDSIAASIIFFIVSLAMSLAIALSTDGEVFLPGAWLPFAVAVPALVQACYVVWAGERKGKGIRADFQLRLEAGDVGLGLLLVPAAFILAGLVSAVLIPLLGDPPTAAAVDFAEDSADGTLTIWIVLFAVIGALAIPVIEELVYRGLLWSALEKRGMDHKAIMLITSAVFAVAHLEPTRTPILLVIGLVLGYGRLRTGRIGASIVTHAAINSIAMVATLSQI